MFANHPRKDLSIISFKNLHIFPFYSLLGSFCFSTVSQRYLREHNCPFLQCLTQSPLEPPDGTQPCRHLDFSPRRPISDFGPPELEQ